MSSAPVGRDGAGGEQQRVARQKRRDDQTGFREDDQEQEAVDPRAVGGDEFEQVAIDVEEKSMSSAMDQTLLERLSEILFQILDVLDAGRDPDQAVGDAERRAVSAGTDACVIVAGWEMSVSTPPRLSASAISRTPFSSRARRLERSELEREHAAEAAHLPRAPARAADATAGPDSRRAATFGCAARNSRQRQAVGVVLRHAQRQRLGAAQHQPRVERAEDRARGVLDEPQPLDVVVARGDDDAADAVAVAVQVLRRAVDDEVGAELERPLQVRARERVVDDEPGAVPVRQVGGRARGR